ncbi:MAG TPA: NAD(P)/FAD-dependent oxidoreductase [Thermoanaerobaculaceae bacterium]|nr:NAD(P)/FAD-dependent oxidoreductase [Thermoanaerobaculaceae bacterium]HRS15110.1 NAD(P)/FAD-dependent oxidoreductase [Thermoanaerobaculaceae bacterium]
MARHRDADVLVVGAGPAGCAAAITLARAGVAATVLGGPETQPRGCELVVPRAVEVLAALGLEPWLGSQARESECTGVRVASADLGRATCLPFPDRPGRVLDRPDLDQALLDAARAAGAEVLPALVAASPAFEGTRLAGVTARGPDEREEIITCKALIDASGRSAFLARRMGWGFPYPRHRRSAAWAVYSGVSPPDWAPPGELTLIALRDGYLWLAPAAGGRTGVGAVLPRRFWEESSGSAERLLGKALGACPAVDWLLSKARAETPPQAAPSLAFRVLDVAGHGFCMVGDAAGFIDPVVPHGLLAALLGGQSAGLDAAEALLQRGRVTAVDFGPTTTLVRLLQRQQLAHVHAFYDPDFLAVLMAGHDHLGARRALRRLLAGDILPPRRWRTLARAWVLVGLAGLQSLTRRLGAPVFPVV